ncbi:hypothetical protein [Sorangium sp. So ce388]|uniref:hypothetical protein n=1 Tax=Sorangium sp. So ce388 TaxID=3133309 RepID=UPI003F5BF97E
MREQRITIEVDGEGRISADAEGFTGDLCLKDLKQLLDGLGALQERVDRKSDASVGVAPQRGRAAFAGKKP